MEHRRAITWLKVVSAVITGFGLATALGAYPPMAGIPDFLLDLLAWPPDGPALARSPDARLLYAIGGGVMTGWGVLLWLLTTRLYPRDPALARLLMLATFGTWFVVDSVASVAAGAASNVVFNVGLLLFFTAPLLRPAPAAYEAAQPAP